jgi:hypothetical protein
MEREKGESAIAQVSEDDLGGLIELRARLQSRDLRNVRFHSGTMFNRCLMVLLEFCQRNNDDAWKRFFVCGIFPIVGGFAIHTRRLGKLLGRSKSAVNGAFSAMGLNAVPTNSQFLEDLRRVLHTRDSQELKCWTIRRATAPVPRAQQDDLNVWGEEMWMGHVEWI